MIVPGSFGFGGAFDAEAVFTGVRVMDTLSGTLLYESDLKNETALDDFGVRENLVDSILDGARRDRIVWIGDVAVRLKILTITITARAHVRNLFRSRHRRCSTQQQRPNTSRDLCLSVRPGKTIREHSPRTYLPPLPSVAPTRSDLPISSTPYRMRYSVSRHSTTRICIRAICRSSRSHGAISKLRPIAC